MRATNLIWIDLEMTGLDTQTDHILEIATVVTDAQLNEIAQGPVIAVHHPETTLKAMGQWCTEHHQQSGLWDRVLQSQINMAQAEQQTLDFLQQHVDGGRSPMCGNSICQDRRFMSRQMPKLEQFFHYRNLDVSTLKELARRWAPEIQQGFKKKNVHLALDDIRESIEELRYYRKYLGALSGLSDS